jgi:hypothetical protein
MLRRPYAQKFDNQPISVGTSFPSRFPTNRDYQQPTMAYVMDDDVKFCYDRALARAEARKAARADPQAAATTESTQTRNQYSATVQYKTNLKFAPKKHQQRDTAAYTSSNIMDCHRELQNFSETVEIEAQNAAAICVMGRPVDALLGTPYTTADGGQARLTDTGEIIAGTFRDGSLKLRALVKAVVVHNGVSDDLEVKIPLPQSAAPSSPTSETKDVADQGGAEDTTEPKRHPETPGPIENLTQVLSDLGESEAVAAATAMKAAAAQTAMRKATIMRGLASATRGTALAEGHDATGASKYDINQAMGGPGDLSGIMPAAAARTLRKLRIYKHIIPDALVRLPLDTDELIDRFVDDTVAFNIALTAGLAEDRAQFDLLGPGITDTADKLEFIIEFIEERYLRLSKHATRLKDEDKQDTAEWSDVISQYAILNQNDVLVAMGDGLQLQAQFSMMKKILEYFYQENPTKAIVKYIRDLGSLTPADGSACGCQMGVIEYGSNFYSGVDEAINGPCNAPILNAFINESKYIAMKPKEAMVEYVDRVREVLITGPSIIAHKSPAIHEALEQAVQTGQLDAVSTAVAGIREWNATQNTTSNFELQSLCADYLLHESTTMIPIKDRNVANQIERLAKLRNKIKAIQTRHTLYSRSTRNSRLGALPKNGATFRQFAAAAVGNIEEVLEETPEPDRNKENYNPPSWVATLLEGMTALNDKGKAPKATALAALEKAMNQKKSPGSKKADKLKPYQGLIDHDCDQTTIPHDAKVTCNYCGHLGHRQITNGVGTCGRMAYDLLHDQPNAHASDERIKFMASKGWDATRPTPGTFKIYPHGGHGPPATGPTPATALEDAGSEIARLKAQIETLKANNSSNDDNSAMAAQIESTVLNAISAHLAELDEDDE